MKEVAISVLSAIGSRSAPTSVRCRSQRASRPSSASVAPQTANTSSAAFPPAGDQQVGEVRDQEDARRRQPVGDVDQAGGVEPFSCGRWNHSSPFDQRQ